MISEKLVSSEAISESLNIGPDQDSFVAVGKVADAVAKAWGSGATWVHDKQDHPHEAGLLALDATRAKNQLQWTNRLNFKDALEWTIDWHKFVAQGKDPLTVSRNQLNSFLLGKGAQ